MRCTVTEGCENQAESGSLGCYVCGDTPKQGVIPATTIVDAKCRVCDLPARKGRKDCSDRHMWKAKQLARIENPAPKAPAASPQYTKAPPVPPALAKALDGLQPGRAMQETFICLDEPELKQLRPAMEFLDRCANALEQMPGMRRVSLTVTVDDQGVVTFEPPEFSRLGPPLK